MTRYFIGFSAKNLPKISNKPIFQQILEQMVDSKPVEQTGSKPRLSKRQQTSTKSKHQIGAKLSLS
ncbi:uncharacterized protein METZ01_LOCUS217313 [marine metagenome]|jgi:hypothetical protein|uniref:Uncharacterized protein n=1 Tax=marine metagenome TaxID=408172 RepID=A0A382FP82_9ZZZZ|tara:strand:+ start:1263 stop:1460 length:198 start_codon:yes stop_codon:yes gene_type:complete